jgi:hypothetical protein
MIRKSGSRFSETVSRTGIARRSRHLQRTPKRMARDDRQVPKAEKNCTPRAPRDGTFAMKMTLPFFGY